MNPSSYIITFTTSTLLVRLLLYVWYFCLYPLCNGVLSQKYIPPLTAESYSFGCIGGIWSITKFFVWRAYMWLIVRYGIHSANWGTMLLATLWSTSAVPNCAQSHCIPTARPDCQQLREPDAAAIITAAVPLQELQSTDWNRHCTVSNCVCSDSEQWTLYSDVLQCIPSTPTFRGKAGQGGHNLGIIYISHVALITRLH